MTEEIGIVVGTTNTMIYKPGNGIVLCEPTKVAYNGDPKLGARARGGNGGRGNDRESA